MTTPTPTPLPRRTFVGRLLAAFAGGALLGRSTRVEAAPAPGATPEGALNFLGEIRLHAGYYEPQSWMWCQGQTLSIAQYDALFSLLGTTYGGDGLETFSLPDLRSRVPIHSGQGPGLPNYSLGELGGVEVLTLTSQQIPAHAHTARASSGVGTSDTPIGNVPARNAAGSPQYSFTPAVDLGANALLSTGGSQPHGNLQPFCGVNYIICVEGVFPPQS